MLLRTYRHDLQRADLAGGHLGGVDPFTAASIWLRLLARATVTASSRI